MKNNKAKNCFEDGPSEDKSTPYMSVMMVARWICRVYLKEILPKQQKVFSMKDDLQRSKHVDNASNTDEHNLRDNCSSTKSRKTKTFLE